jgi:hypothetical protein
MGSCINKTFPAVEYRNSLKLFLLMFIARRLHSNPTMYIALHFVKKIKKDET